MQGCSRDISKDTCWFVPLSQLNHVQGARLDRVFSPLADDDEVIEDGGSFTITLESFLIDENHDDERSGNDLLVKSKVRYGNEPAIESINFFGIDIPAETVREHLEFEHIFGRENHSAKNRVWLEVTITEIDKGLKDDAAILQDLKELNAEFGAVFPTLIPFSGLATSAVACLSKVAALQEQNKLLFKSQIDFYGLFSDGEAKLRCGAYILFNQPVEACQYQLRGLQLEYFTPSEKGKPVRDDYVIIKIVPALISSGNDQELRENQQLATVLSHAHSEDDRTTRIAQREVLKEFVSDALQFRDLKSLITLKTMKDIGKPMSPQQLANFYVLSDRLSNVLNALK
ncbi:hypothetical protein ACQ4M4_21890 [Leptolyngbya sp. AN02str]|uniref:hypothetical protein n=1 Tax=Leptolyngbya sp. AN02str TaxID=3423363 RepID=UPI003D314676